MIMDDISNRRALPFNKVLMRTKSSAHEFVYVKTWFSTDWLYTLLALFLLTLLAYFCCQHHRSLISPLDLGPCIFRP